MFNPTQLIIDEFVKNLKANYHKIYGKLEPDYPNILTFIGNIALENIANSDALYHDLYHTIMVTEVAQQILLGKHIAKGGVNPQAWLHFVIASLCHDIGYVRGVCKDDKEGKYIINTEKETVTLKRGATDASLTKYHINRSKIFIEERFKNVIPINYKDILEMIDRTTFPIPEKPEYQKTDDLPGLLRAADLIGQIGDINYLKKIASLFMEFEEIGTAKLLKYKNTADLRKNYPKFFWEKVKPIVNDAFKYLQITQEGKQWIANVYANVFAEEHEMLSLGVERGKD